MIDIGEFDSNFQDGVIFVKETKIETAAYSSQTLSVPTTLFGEKGTRKTLRHAREKNARRLIFSDNLPSNGSFGSRGVFQAVGSRPLPNPDFEKENSGSRSQK